MKVEEIINLIKAELGEDCLQDVNLAATQPYVYVLPEKLIEVCKLLKQHSLMYFDLLSCITAVDLGADKNAFEVVYTLFSIPFAHALHVRVNVDKSKPEIPTVSTIWKTADWHEREAYDLMGIKFIGHPDLRRILLPANWEGYPLRKDYTEQEYYHGVKVKY